MNQKGFIPIIFIIIIGAVVATSATFSVVKYKDEITANVSNVFKSKIEVPNTELKATLEPIIGGKQDDAQKLQEQLRTAEQKQLEAEKQLAEERTRQVAEKNKAEEEARVIAEQGKQQQASLSIKSWSELETQYFAEANQKGWGTLIITNALGEKRYYKKDGNQWIRKNSEAEIQQNPINPITGKPCLDKNCSLDLELELLKLRLNTPISLPPTNFYTPPTYNPPSYTPPIYNPLPYTPLPNYSLPPLLDYLPQTYSPPKTPYEIEYDIKVCESIGGTYSLGLGCGGY